MRSGARQGGGPRGGGGGGGGGPPAGPASGPPAMGRGGGGAGGGGRKRWAGAVGGLALAAGALRLGGAGVEAGAEAVWPEQAVAGSGSRVTVHGAAFEGHWLGETGGWAPGLDVHCHFGTAKSRAVPEGGRLLCSLPPLPPGFVAVGLSPNGVDVTDSDSSATLLVTSRPRAHAPAAIWTPAVLPGGLAWLSAQSLFRGAGRAGAPGEESAAMGGCRLSTGIGVPEMGAGAEGALRIQSSALAACEVPPGTPPGPTALSVQGLEIPVEVDTPTLCTGASPEARVLPVAGGLTFTAQMGVPMNQDQTLLCRFGSVSVNARRSGAASASVDCTSPALAPTLLGARGGSGGRMMAPGLAHGSSGASVASCPVDGDMHVSVHPVPRALGVVGGGKGGLPEGRDGGAEVTAVAVEGPPPEVGAAAFCLVGSATFPALGWDQGMAAKSEGRGWAWTARCALEGLEDPLQAGPFVEISAGSSAHLLQPGRGVPFARAVEGAVDVKLRGGIWTAKSAGAFDRSGAVLLRQVGRHGGLARCPDQIPPGEMWRHSSAVVACEIAWPYDTGDSGGNADLEVVQAFTVEQQQLRTGPTQGGSKIDIPLSGTPSGSIACFIGTVGPLSARLGSSGGGSDTLTCVSPALEPNGGGDALSRLDMGSVSPKRGYPVAIGANSGAGTRLEVPGSGYIAVVEPVLVSAGFEAGHAGGGYGGIDSGAAVIRLEAGAPPVLSGLAESGQLGCLAGVGGAASAARAHGSSVLCGPEAVAGFAPQQSSFYTAGIIYPWGRGQSTVGLQWSVSRSAPVLLHALPVAPSTGFGDIVRLKGRHLSPGTRCIFHESADSVTLAEPDGEVLSPPLEQKGAWAESPAHVLSSAFVVCEVPTSAGPQKLPSWGAVSVLRGLDDAALGLRSSNSLAFRPGGAGAGPIQTWEGGSGLEEGGTLVTATTWGLGRALTPAMAFGTVRVTAQVLQAVDTLEAVAPALVPERQVALRVSATGVTGSFGLEGQASYTALPNAPDPKSRALGMGPSQKAAWPPSVEAGSHVLLASQPRSLRGDVRLAGCVAGGEGSSTCAEAPAVTSALGPAFSVYIPPGTSGAVALKLVPPQILLAGGGAPPGLWAETAEVFTVASPEVDKVWPAVGPAGEDAVVWLSARNALPSTACSQPLGGISGVAHFGPGLVACEVHFPGTGHREPIGLVQPAFDDTSEEVGLRAPFIAGASVASIGGNLGSAVAAPLVVGGGLPKLGRGSGGARNSYVAGLRPAEALRAAQNIVGASGGGVLEITTAGVVDFDTGVGRGWPACDFGAIRVEARPLIDSNVACVVPSLGTAAGEVGAPARGPDSSAAAGLNFVRVGIEQGPGAGLAPRRRVAVAVQPEPAIVSTSAGDALEEVQARRAERLILEEEDLNEQDGLWMVITGVGDWLAHLRCTFAVEGAMAAPLHIVGGLSGDSRLGKRAQGSPARAAVQEWAVCRHPPFPASGLSFATVQVLGQGEGRPLFSGEAQGGGSLNVRIDAVVPGRGVQSGGGSLLFAFGEGFPAGRRFLLSGSEALAVSSAVAIVEAPPAPSVEESSDAGTPREPALESHPRLATNALGPVSNLPLEWVKTWVVESAWPPLGPDTGGVEIEVLGRGPAPAHGESGRPAGVCRFGSTGPVAGRTGGKAGGIACLAPAHGPGEAALRVAFDGGSDWSATSASFRY